MGPKAQTACLGNEKGRRVETGLHPGAGTSTRTRNLCVHTPVLCCLCLSRALQFDDLPLPIAHLHQHPTKRASPWPREGLIHSIGAAHKDEHIARWRRYVCRDHLPVNTPTASRPARTRRLARQRVYDIEAPARVALPCGQRRPRDDITLVLVRIEKRHVR